jgi:hypothetical protein
LLDHVAPRRPPILGWSLAESWGTFKRDMRGVGEKIWPVPCTYLNSPTASEAGRQPKD